MNDFSNRNKNFPNSCFFTFVLIMMITGCFLLLFSYTGSVLSVNTSLLFSDIYEEFNSELFSVQRYSWQCQNNKCVKNLAGDEEISLATCNMMCTQPVVWPKPANLQVTNKAVSIIDKTKISFDFSGQGLGKIMLQNTTELFVKNLGSLKPSISGNQSRLGTNIQVNISLSEDTTDKLRLNTNETYHLTVENKDFIRVSIFAQNYFGARHALETLSQLIWYDETEDCLKIIHDVEIIDYPKFPYRGLMVDTARNFFPLAQLKKVVDGMAMAKLNVLHLHATDAASFPLVLPRVEQLASFGAYGPDMIYTADDIKSLVEYGLTRGVRVILEVDAPSHVNAAAWNFPGSASEKNVICGDDDVFNGHLNPDNADTLNILEQIYKDLLELNVNNEIFHIGSDEVDLKCWRNTEASKRVKNQKQFWADYTNKMLDRLKSANGGDFPEHVVMWSSPLTESKSIFETLTKKMTVQHWLGDFRSILENGHNIIFSTVGNWYLDCGFGPWKPSVKNGNCDPYKTWQTFYNHRPWTIYSQYKELTLGGEVCLWTEQVEVDDLETRIWPRSAAFAERIWSDPDSTDNHDVLTRLMEFSDRLKSRGIRVAGIWPRWCSQNPGKC